MECRPIIAWHLVWCAYGFWLPNDPRGSWSTEVQAEHLRPFGEATKVSVKRSLAANKHDHGLRLRAKSSLKREPVRLTAVQARAVGTSIGVFAGDHGLVLRAMAVMPDHVHLIVDALPGMTGRGMIVLLKSAATRGMNDAGVHPYRVELGDRVPTPWARGGWDRFLHTESEVAGAVRCVETNPERSGLPRQAWRCLRSAFTRSV